MDINGCFPPIAAQARTVKHCLRSIIELSYVLADTVPAKDAAAVDESIRTFHGASAYLALICLRFF